MDLAQLDPILATVCDVIDSQGGDWDATEAVLRGEYSGEELAMALDTYAATLLIVYAEPGGPAFIRGMAERRRNLRPAPPRRVWSRWRATG